MQLVCFVISIDVVFEKDGWEKVEIILGKVGEGNSNVQYFLWCRFFPSMQTKILVGFLTNVLNLSRKTK